MTAYKLMTQTIAYKKYINLDLMKDEVTSLRIMSVEKRNKIYSENTIYNKRILNERLKL